MMGRSYIYEDGGMGACLKIFETVYRRDKQTRLSVEERQQDCCLRIKLLDSNFVFRCCSLSIINHFPASLLFSFFLIA